jgi:hypothetical protein
MPRKKSPRRTPAWMRRLTAAALALGVIATLSYGAGAHIAVRYLDPPLGAWWNSNEFAILECAAAAVGMLIGIRLGARLVDSGPPRNRSTIAAVIVGALVLPIVGRVGAELARFRFTSGAPAHEWIIDRFGYDAGKFLDKLLAAGVYSIKIAAFALPVGMIAFGVAIALFMTAETAPETVGRNLL